MTQALDKDTRMIIIIGILIAQVVLIGALLMYFRKKENDALINIFYLQDRVNALEVQVRQLSTDEPGKTKTP